jgi:hypothetical protein
MNLQPYLVERDGFSFEVAPEPVDQLLDFRPASVADLCPFSGYRRPRGWRVFNPTH